MSTDKVDSEVPAPASGVVSEILVPEGETVAVGVRLAVIGDGALGAAPARGAPPRPRADTRARARTRAGARARAAPPRAGSRPGARRRGTAASTGSRAGSAAAPAPPAPAPTARRRATRRVAARAQLLAEYGLDPSQIRGTGDGGRITRNDVLEAARSGRRRAPRARPPPRRPSSAPADRRPPAAAAPARRSAARAGDDDRARSTTSAAAPPSTWCGRRRRARTCTRRCEVDFERVERIRRAHRRAFKAEEGFSLTYLPFIVPRLLRRHARQYPNVNASVDGESLVVHHDIHLGIAVDLDFKGLLAAGHPQRRRQAAAAHRA